MMFDHLFSPFDINKSVLPNRICFLAHRTHFSRNGRLHNRHLGYYRRRAEGGCALIILGELSVHPGDQAFESLIQMYHPSAVSDLRKLTDTVHDYSTRIFAQLTHRGFQSTGAITRREVWAPSAMSDFVFGETAKAMELEDMKDVIEAFSQGAEKIMQGGFDGIEIDMGPESLLRQFLSPISNHRTDEYGGSLENRMRFPLAVIAAVRDRVGPDFPTGVRLCADEQFWGGITTED